MKPSESSCFRKCFFTFVVIGILAGAIFGIVVYKNTEVVSFCENLADNSSFLAVQNCEQLKCVFPTWLCNLVCPFGYAAGDDACPTSCLCASESTTYQGDIQFVEEQIPSMLKTIGLLNEAENGFSLYRGSTPLYTDLWIDDVVNGRYQVPYVILSSEYSEKERKTIKEQLQKISQYTCLDFPKRTTESFYITVKNGRGCASSVGKAINIRGATTQTVSLRRGGCFQMGTPSHEFIHTLGFQHEHSRADRDDYIRIHEENIPRDKINNFYKLVPAHTFDEGLPLDYSSVMLYHGYSFSSNGRATVTRVDTGEPTVREGKVSELDLEGIRRIYNCPGSFPTVSPTARTLRPFVRPAGGSVIRPKGSSGVSAYYWTEWDEWEVCKECRAEDQAARFKACNGFHLDFCKNLYPKSTYWETKRCSLTPGCGGGGGSSGDRGGAWSTWGQWSACYGNVQWAERSRKCSGRSCPGKNVERKPCRRATWSGWGSWQGCGNRCDRYKFARRTRTCNGGAVSTCQQQNPQTTSSEQRSCSEFPSCETHWGQWNRWSTCSVTCGRGFQSRTRTCLTNRCTHGSRRSEQPCNARACPRKVYVWGEWQGWKGCEYCGTNAYGGRKRNCRNGQIFNCEQTAPKSRAFERTQCSKLPDCKNRKRNLQWGVWGPWTGCANCESSGSATRSRTCLGGNVEECVSHFREPANYNRRCTSFPCAYASWSPWQEWRQCSKTCDTGWRIRYRTCSTANKCSGLPFKAEYCNRKKCKVEPTWSSWTALSPCLATCGNLAVQVLGRSCLPSGSSCDGVRHKIKRCEQIPCPQNDESMLDDVESSIFQSESTSELLCEANVRNTWIFGDFNGDRMSDLMCGKDGNTFKVGFSGDPQITSNVDWEGILQDCSGDVKLAADFDGDGADDLLCQDKSKRSLSVTLSDNGSFNGKPSYKGTFCSGDEDVVLLLDANGDKQTDIICRHQDSGDIEILTLTL